MRTSVAVSSGALEPNMEQTRLHPLWMIEGGAVSKSTPAADSRAREVGESSWLTETSSSSLQSGVVTVTSIGAMSAMRLVRILVNIDCRRDGSCGKAALMRCGNETDMVGAP